MENEFLYLGSIRLSLNPAYLIEKFLLEKKHWEPHVEALLFELIRPGLICLDIGANVGIHTLALAKKVGETGKVISFEPNGFILPRLKRNVSLNPSLSDRIEINEFALSDSEGEFEIFQEPDSALGNASLTKRSWNKKFEDFPTCKVVTLDSLKLERVDFLKIDVEGMELEVLQGGRKTVERSLPTMIVETLPGFGEEKRYALENFLIDMGYELFHLERNICRLIPVRMPYLSQDTICIHRSRLFDYFHLYGVCYEGMLCLKDLVLDPPGLPEMSIKAIRLLNYSVVYQCLFDELPVAETVARVGDPFSFHFSNSGESYRIELELNDRAVYGCVRTKGMSSEVKGDLEPSRSEVAWS